MLLLGNCLDELKKLDDCSVDCCVTSPPYWGLRDYGVVGQLGLESTPEEYTKNLVNVFKEVKRVLKKDGTLWLNLGDSYAGGGNNRGNSKTLSLKQSSNKGAIGQVGKIMPLPKPKFFGLKPKDLVGIPWRVAFALQADGWYLRQDIIWHKPNPMPESVRDRCTKAHEYIFLLSKSESYYFDNDAIRVPHKRLWNSSNGGNFSDVGHKKHGKIQNKSTHPKGYPAPNPLGANRRSVWSVSTKPFKGAHFATFPPDLIEPCILAGCPENGIVLDPFFGAGTTGLVAKNNKRNFIGIELNETYLEIAKKRIENG